MRALVLQNAFGLDNLAIVQRPDPTPGPGQVLVRVRAASLNYRDLLLAKGVYNPKLKFPRVLGSDAAGEVVAVGSGVANFKPGDRVIGCFMQHWVDGPISETVARSSLGSDRDGVLSELVVLEENGLVPIPADLSFAEAATLALCGPHRVERSHRRRLRAGQRRSSYKEPAASRSSRFSSERPSARAFSSRRVTTKSWSARWHSARARG